MCTCTMYFYTLVILKICFGFAMNSLIGLYHIFSMPYVRLFHTIEGKLKWNSSQSLPIKEYVLVDPLFWSFITEFICCTVLNLCVQMQIIYRYVYIIDVGLILNWLGLSTWC